MKTEFSHRDALIVGGGVAGLAAALHCLRAGMRVTVAEKESGQPDKVCGEGILPFGVAELAKLGLENQVRAAGFSFNGITYECDHGNGLKRVTGHFTEGNAGIGIARGELHQVLLSACVNHLDCDYRTGFRVKPEDAAQFDTIFAADGVNSLLGRAYGRRPVFSKRLGARFRIQVPVEPTVRVRFLRGAEIYLTPVGRETLSVAMLIDGGHVSGGHLREWAITQFRQAFPEFEDREIEGFKARGPIASRMKGPMPPFPLLGDALRAFDPISGAGMSFALVCAARAVAFYDDPGAYYRAMRPVMRSVDGFTSTVLFFRGGGPRTRLMLRQLGRAPAAFQRILSLHDGRHGMADLGVRHALSLLRV